MIKASIILDSISEQEYGGVRLTTMELVYPRFIHAEFMTHRVFSRNSSSSRAIPANKMIERIRNEPAMPIHWGKNQSGMQAATEVEDIDLAQSLWLEACEQACVLAEKMINLGLHKQVANRITEPFAHITVLVTATDWENFFILRDHDDAQPEIRELARQMRIAMDNSTPTLLHKDEWHLPFVLEEEKATTDIPMLRKLSAARCARVSYLTHDGAKPNEVKDLQLYDRLITSKPIHASPIEHQATPITFRCSGSRLKKDGTIEGFVEIPTSGNFRGWLQHRKLIEENDRP